MLESKGRSLSTIDQYSPGKAPLYKPSVGGTFQFDNHRLQQLKIVENESEGLLGKRTSRMHLKFDVADDTDDQEILQVAQVIESSDTYRQ